MNATAADPRALRDALGQYPTGVAIVTALGLAGRPLGLTMNSVASVSLKPPLVLFSVAQAALSLPELTAAPACAINILARDQGPLAECFARAGSNKWDGVVYEPGLHGAPLLAGAAALLECVPEARHAGGDHVIFVCRVARFRFEPTREPLVFHRGRYAALDPGFQQEANWQLAMYY